MLSIPFHSPSGFNLLKLTPLALILFSLSSPVFAAGEWYIDGNKITLSQGDIDASNRSDDQINLEGLDKIYGVYAYSESDLSSPQNITANNNALTIRHKVQELGGSGHEIIAAKAESSFGSLTVNDNTLNLTELKTPYYAVRAAKAVLSKADSKDTNTVSVTANNNSLNIYGSELKGSPSTGDAIAAEINTASNISQYDLPHKKIDSIEATGNSVLLSNFTVGGGGGIKSTTVNTVYAVQVRRGSERETIPGSATDHATTYNISSNSVIIEKDSTVNYNAYGIHFNIPTTKTSTIKVNDNTVSIADSTVNGNAAGVWMERSSADEITGNSVKLLGNTNVKGTVYGAFGGSDDSITAYNQGNFIEAQGVHNNVNLIDGFETLKLTVGNENLSTIDEGKNGDKAVLTVGASSAGDTEKHTISFSDRKIELSSAESFSPETGYLNLIHVDGPNVAVALPEASVITWNDTFINTEWELTDNQLTYENGDTLTLSITKEESEPEPTPTPGDEDDEDQGGNKPIKPTDQYANSNAQTLSRASLGAAALIGTSLEYIADEGINIFNDATKAHPDGINAFAAVYGSTNNYDGNANFDLDTVTAITGVTTRRNDAVIAAFIEAGRGWEDSDIGSAHTDAEYNP